MAFIVIQRKKIYSFLFVIWSLVLFSPLEQFRILPLFQIEIFNLDFSFTNGAMIMTLSLGSFLFLCYLYVSPSLYLGSEKQGTFLVANNRWFLVIESLYTAVANIILTNLGVVGQAFFPFLFTLFLFILLSNVIGLIPYSFTVTSHIIFTACLAIVIFTGMVILGIAHHGIHYLNLFLPGGTSLALSFLIIPIEIISFFAKPISLAVRLFANMMAGHTFKSYCWFCMDYDATRWSHFCRSFSCVRTSCSAIWFRVRGCFNSVLCIFSTLLFFLKRLN